MVGRVMGAAGRKVDADLSHQPCQSLGRAADALLAQLGMDTRRPVGPPRAQVDLRDLLAEIGVSHRPCRWPPPLGVTPSTWHAVATGKLGSSAEAGRGPGWQAPGDPAPRSPTPQGCRVRIW